MPILERREITIAEAKRLLEAEGDSLDPLQRRVLDYAIKFSKGSEENATKIVEELSRSGLLEKALAVQIVNCMPKSVEEIRAFLGRQRIISEDALKAILGIIEKYGSI